MAVGEHLAGLTLTFLTLLTLQDCSAQVLTPPYFNLGVGKRIEATATCGEGVTEPELFCKLTGADIAVEDQVPPNYEVIQGQLCDVCNPNVPDQYHPPKQALDGREKWWQSPPLSRGIEFNRVNLTINLGQEFHVAYVFIKMANSPRPGVFALERSTDYGQTWKPWQYFADTLSDCKAFFGDEFETSITRDDSVICTTHFSKVVPLEGGEIVVSLVNNRPSANNFSYANTLQEWTKCTNVRLRLLRTKTLLGHLMAVARQDPTVTRRYFYSIKDISLGGRCVCNGHAGNCDLTDPSDPFKLLCRCEHNTCGSQCERCCDGFVQKPWKPATVDDINSCEPCNCHGHSTECFYNETVADNRQSLDINGHFEGGGVCQNCQHNTAGINCEKCKPGFFRAPNVPIDSPYACQRCRCDLTYSTGACEENTGRCLCRPEYTGQNCDRCNLGYFGYPLCTPCTCNVNGTAGDVCEVGGGQCPCKPNYSGNNCDQCAAGFYGFPDCQSCTCDSYGSLSPYCDPRDGMCRCRNNYGGRDCRECASGYYRYPTCQLCDCDPTGSAPEMCDSNNGQCICKPGFGGSRCDRCASGFYRYPICTECSCQSPGSLRDVCDDRGQCYCNPNYSGMTCDTCAPGYYRYPECLSCNCDRYGSYGVSCDQVSGQCTCQQTFEGLTCDKCRPNFYNYPHCEECNCNPAGAKEVPGYPLGGCGAGVTGLLCECKDRVKGRNCETCKQGYWNLNNNNPLGCEDCGCYKPGAVGGSRVCGTDNGDCVCKPFVSRRQCDQCLDGTYNLQDYNVFGCQDCECDNGGALDHVCNKDSGQCNCRPRVQGRRCNRPLMNHFFPTLYQQKYEMENGRTDSGGAVRYAFDKNVFPDFSWRGYAVLSRLQEEVLVDVDIRKPSLYRLIFRFVNSNASPITAEVSVTPETSSDVPQTSTVVFQPTNEPHYVTAPGSGVVTPFVLNPGRWTIALKSPENLLVDYLVLLPQDYYEAGILQERVHRPCTVPFTDELCKHFVYVDLSAYTVVRGETGYTRIGGSQDPTQVFPDQFVNEDLGVPNMAYLDRAQENLILNMVIPEPGKYVLLIQYHSDVTGRNQDINVDVNTAGGNADGVASLPGCPYSSLCRQVVKNNKGNVKVFDIADTQMSITISGGADLDLAIDSIIAIPHKEWNIEYITPKLKCLRMDMKCMESTFLVPTGSVRTDIESGNNADRVATDIPPHIIDTNIRVIKIDGFTPTVTVKASIITPGPYIFVVHYYQPYQSNSEVHVTVDIEGQLYHGKFDAKYCPGVSGCRAVIRFDDIANNAVNINGFDYSIAFNNSHGHPIWLDYVLAIPQIQFESNVLEILPVDTASVFVTKCGQNNYYMGPNTQGFCRDSIFSLTTDYNNGALSCECNSEGSLSFSCDEFGGQCNCRPDVIGRTCSECRTGFYGFPNCRPCNCPSGLCDPKSGQCVCPPRVTGPTCNVCLPRTFGYDRLIGCEECNCDPYGVLNNELECDIDSGQCQCKPNVDGRRCDLCVTGHYNFPRCSACSCNFRGSTADICDQSSGSCLCKENVEGPQCAQCKQSTFYLEERNPKGCTNCFCFGTTQSCSSSSYRRTEVRTLEGWGITNMRRPQLTLTARSIEVFVEEPNLIEPKQALYWVAPEPYLGNKVTSYGGKLIYTVTFTLPRGQPSSGVVISDIRIEGNNFTLVHTSPQQPVENVPLPVEIDLFETQFVHESTEAQATREQFMMLLAKVESLQIRASYYSVVESVNLADVHMDIATPEGTGSLARNVEQCQCPPNYRGTSCEECAEGYYRSRTGGYLGVCVQCQCNNKADTCDPYTGECINCRDNFGGPQCLSCKQGYYLDDYTRRCEICSCPLPIESNNFASTCVVYNGILQRCICLSGYTGQRCDQCSPGHYGDPRVQGGTCQSCDCSGNIDLNDRYSCDPSTGQCLRCINNSEGPRCENCRPWYYGDAVDRKDCQPCNCDTYGTERCDHRSGGCFCKPNVVGDRCDQCAPGTFGFQSGQGCEPCNCGQGSLSQDCDLNTGQCTCQPGVQGRQCDQCQEGYWNYGPFGCTKCQCEFEGATSCDPQTGRCVCKPGFTGPSCADCLDRWILVPGVGCQECDNCVQLLIDDVEVMERNTTTISKELESVSAGVTAFRRLEKVNKTVQGYRPLVDAMLRSGGDPNENTILEPLQKEQRKMEDLSKDIFNRAQRVARQSNVVREDAADSRDDSDVLADLIRDGVAKANDAVRFAEEVLQDILSNINNQNAQYLIQEAERILDEIRGRDFFDRDDECRVEYEAAEDRHNRATSLKDRTNENLDELVRLQNFLMKVDDKFRDLMNSSRHSLDNSQAALDHNSRNQEDILSITGDLENVKKMREDASAMITMARDQISQALQFVRDADAAYSDVERESSRLDEAMSRLQTSVDDFADENLQLRPEVDRATEHAQGLQREAQRLKDMIAGTTDSAAGAVNASNAYRAITESINDAQNASKTAVDNAEEAVKQTNGLADRARESKARSEELKNQADNTKSTVTNELKPRLDTAKDKTDQLSETNQQTEDALTDFLLSLNSLSNGYGGRAQQAVDRAINSQQRAEEAQNKIQGILDMLPEDAIKVAQIPRDIEEANRDVQRAQTQVDNVLRLVPDATDLLDRLVTQSDRVNRIGVDLTQGITLLKERIARSREEASRIRVGVKFLPNTTLQVRNPQNLAQSGSYTKLSMFFKTVKDNGFLAYIGPDRPTGRVPSDDYFALEVVNRKATLKFDLGAGPAVVTVDKDVSDGEWHEVIAERTGKSASLVVRTHKEEDVEAEGESEGTFSVLDLNPATTKFFIGGIPSDAQLGDKLTSQRLEGCIEEVRFDGLPLGLWNFVTGENINGCLTREVLKGAQTNGFRFNGQGAVKIERGYFKPQKLSQIQMKFKTFSENGLLLLMPGDKNMDFMSIELKEGKVLFQYDLGSGVGSFETAEKYNDGRWHTVFGNRRNQNGLIKVDNATAANGKSPGNMRDLDVAEELYIGGFRNTVGHTHRFEQVTQQGFDGCIQDVFLGGTLKDLNSNLFAIGVVPGCPDIARVVSFRQDVPNGYIAMDPVDVDELFQTTLKVKTVESGGLVSYLANDDQSNSLSISLVDGKIVVQTVAGSDKINKVETNVNTYNDGRWHYITVRKEGKTLQLNVDDTEVVETPMKGKKRITTTSPLYFGGYPAGYTIKPGNTATTQRFIGCVGDVTVNGNFINFALAPPESQGGASLARCPLPDLQASTPAPTLSPTAVTIPAASNLIRPERCVLPEEPVVGGVADDSGGARFGSQPFSRWEFDKAPDAFRVVSNFSLEFKTTENDGVLFYVADNRQVDFIALYMKDGKLVFSFNCGTGPAVLTSTNTFADGNWHTVVFWRRQWRGRLTVDGISEAEDRAKGNARSINISPPLYVGGLAEEEATKTTGNLNAITDGFKGCIRNVQLNEMDFGRHDREFFVEPCSDSVETGSFFYSDGGYIKLSDNFHVGLDLEISMNIKPRSHSGVLLSVSSAKEDYFLIQMVDGEIVCSVNNGGGTVRTSLKPAKSNALCNGQWHNIKAVKAKNVVTLFVDEVSAYPGIGQAGISSTDTNDPLYIGGIPVSHTGVETNSQYVGCIKDITLNGSSQNLGAGTIYGRVTNSCPTT